MKVETTDTILRNFITLYSRTKKPVDVDFRKLVSWISYGERATHYIHSYPAKLLVHIPHFFLSSHIVAPDNSKIYDPFCGSGTVLLESILLGKNAIGSDVNPLAVLIAKVKTKLLNITTLNQTKVWLKENIPTEAISNQLDVINRDYWFYPHVQKKLLRIYDGITRIRNKNYRDFYLVCLSSCVRRVSLANPRMSVPVKLNVDNYDENDFLRGKLFDRLKQLKRINVINEFFKIVELNIQRMKNFAQMKLSNSKSSAFLLDCKNSIENSSILSKNIDKESIDLIITSPPYIGAQKYIRASSLNLGWLNICQASKLKYYESLSIGREHYHKKDYAVIKKTGIEKADEILVNIEKINPLRACIAASYLVEMKDAFKTIEWALRPGGYLVLIVANNHVCKIEFPTQDYLQEIAKIYGFITKLILVDEIHSRGLMTKRNKSSALINKEWVYLFQKD